MKDRIQLSDILSDINYAEWAQGTKTRTSWSLLAIAKIMYNQEARKQGEKDSGRGGK